MNGFLISLTFSLACLGLGLLCRRPAQRAFLAVLAVAIGSVFTIAWLEQSPLGRLRFDLTEDRLYTLSAASQKTLHELQDPVTLHFYRTLESESASQEMKRYAQRVDEWLREFEAASNGKLIVQRIEPLLDTPSADAAALDGQRPLRFANGDVFYLGLSVSCVDRKMSFPLLDPAAADAFEAELSSAIASVSRPRLQKLGILSPLSVFGNPLALPGQPGYEAWIATQELEQSFQVERLAYSLNEVPKEIDLLLLIHPANLPANTEYALDQFVLRGGRLLVALDAFSIEAVQSNGETGIHGGGISSTLPHLLRAWGVISTQPMVVADPQYRSKLKQGRESIAILSITDQAITEASQWQGKMRDLFWILPTAFDAKPPSGLQATALLQCSPLAGPVPAEPAYNFDPQIARALTPSPQPLAFVLDLQGRFPSAFSGPPKIPAAPQPLNQKPLPPQDSTDPKYHRAEGSGHVILLGDVDFLGNQAAYRSEATKSGQIKASYANDNFPLLMLCLDRLLGKDALNDGRRSVSQRRPFLVFNEIEQRFDAQFGAKQAEIDAEIEQAKLEIAKVQNAENATQVALTPEQEARLRRAQAVILDKQKEKRALRQEFTAEIDREESRIFKLNLLFVPTLLLTFALLFLGIRHRLTSPR